MTAPVIRYEARLSELVPHSIPHGAPWYVTHGLGKPAAGTYTEVAFTRDARFGAALDTEPEVVIEEVVRRVAVELYGTAWAFVYRPEQYDDSIGRFGLRRRERVVVTAIEVYR